MTQLAYRVLHNIVPVLALGLLFPLSVHSADSLSIKAEKDTEITLEIYPADGEILLIWQPHEIGLQSIDQQLARQLAVQGIEVWLTDILEAYFLPNTESSMDRVPASGFSAVLEAASQRNKTVILATSGRGAIPVMRGMHHWQQQQPASKVPAGLLLLSPKLFVETPDPGEAAYFMPIAEATNQSILIMQPDKSPWYWKLDQTLTALQKSGSDVYLWPLRGMRDRFYFRPDATPAEQTATASLANQLAQGAGLLAHTPLLPRQVPALQAEEPAVREGKRERELQTYKGDPRAPPLALPDLGDKLLDLRALKGQVVLVNFWASWCPPCVHEMPSMQRLQNHFASAPFTILGVNMAEDKATIEQFLREKVSVSFPIVQDRDGQALKAWGVFAFPTSYVIDRQGRIRYALFGSVEWDTPDIKQKIRQLLDEAI